MQVPGLGARACGVVPREQWPHVQRVDGGEPCRCRPMVCRVLACESCVRRVPVPHGHVPLLAAPSPRLAHRSIISMSCCDCHWLCGGGQWPRAGSRRSRRRSLNQSTVSADDTPVCQCMPLIPPSQFANLPPAMHSSRPRCHHTGALRVVSGGDHLAAASCSHHTHRHP